MVESEASLRLEDVAVNKYVVKKEVRAEYSSDTAIVRRKTLPS